MNNKNSEQKNKQNDKNKEKHIKIKKKIGNSYKDIF